MWMMTLETLARETLSVLRSSDVIAIYWNYLVDLAAMELCSWKKNYLQIYKLKERRGARRTALGYLSVD